MANLMSAWEKMSVLFTLNELPTQQTTSPYSCMIVIISCTAEQSKGKLEVLLYTAILCSSFLPSLSFPSLSSFRPSFYSSFLSAPTFVLLFIHSINQLLFFFLPVPFLFFFLFLFFHSFFLFLFFSFLLFLLSFFHSCAHSFSYKPFLSFLFSFVSASFILTFFYLLTFFLS